MSHEDFATFIGQGRMIAGHSATISDGFDAMRILRIDHSTEIPLVFEAHESFESRVERMEALIEGWEMRQRTAA